MHADLGMLVSMRRVKDGAAPLSFMRTEPARRPFLPVPQPMSTRGKGVEDGIFTLFLRRFYAPATNLYPVFIPRFLTFFPIDRTRFTALHWVPICLGERAPRGEKNVDAIYLIAFLVMARLVFMLLGYCESLSGSRS